MRVKPFGEYVFEKVVGGGIYTKVYRAYSVFAKPTYGKVVAIKILRLTGSRRERAKLIKQFEREAEIAMSLDHPNVVKVFNFGKIDNYYAMIMEFVDGKNLKEIIYEREKFQLPFLIKICYEAGKGLSYIHQNKIVHKDVKPDNILVSNDYKVVKITDFGIAKLPSRKFGKDIFPKGGTITKFSAISYIPPEQAEGDADYRSDIYSFGVTIDEVICAKLSISGRDDEDYFARIDIPSQRKKMGKQRVLCEHLDIPEKLKKIIIKATEPDRNLRYQKIDDMLKDLEEFLPENEN